MRRMSYAPLRWARRGSGIMTLRSDNGAARVSKSTLARPHRPRARVGCSQVERWRDVARSVAPAASAVLAEPDDPVGQLSWPSDGARPDADSATGSWQAERVVPSSTIRRGCGGTSLQASGAGRSGSDLRKAPAQERPCVAVASVSGCRSTPECAARLCIIGGGRAGVAGHGPRSAGDGEPPSRFGGRKDSPSPS